MRLVVRGAWRTAVVVAVLVAIAMLATARGHVPLPANPDGVVAATQIARAETLPGAELLVLGDSSAMTDVDVDVLGRERGSTSAESLATLGFVGPAGYAALLERLTARHVRPHALVLLVHRESLVFTEDVFARSPYERAALGGAAHTVPSVVRDTKTALAGALRSVVPLPLIGPWGVAYGSPGDLRRHIERHHGTMVDPTPRRSRAGAGVYEYRLSEAVARRLPRLADALAAAAPRCFALGLTPDPAGHATHDLPQRHAVLARVAELLRVAPTALLELPPALADDLFATSAHLNAEGRRVYTPLVAAALRAKPGCEPRTQRARRAPSDAGGA